MEPIDDKRDPEGSAPANTAGPALRVVQQKNRSSGCGPAVVATVAGVTYEEAIMAMWGRPLTLEPLFVGERPKAGSELSGLYGVQAETSQKLQRGQTAQHLRLPRRHAA